MTAIDKLMKRCQIGTANYNDANDLHSDCYGAIGKLRHELKEMIEDAIEYAMDALAVHEANLGRTTDKNRHEAERIEADIAKWKAMLDQLNTEANNSDK